jgi:hypothetical protein
MNRLNNITALFTTPPAFALNIVNLQGQLNVVSTILTILLSLVSIISLCYVIRANIARRRREKIQYQEMQLDIEIKRHQLRTELENQVRKTENN